MSFKRCYGTSLLFTAGAFSKFVYHLAEYALPYKSGNVIMYLIKEKGGKRMKAVFINDCGNISTVYASKLLERLSSLTELSDRVYSHDEAIASPEDFRDTEYIFSTWGMPHFTEEEIESTFPALKGVFYGAGTVQKFARPFLNKGIKVFSAWAANAVPVAEYTVAQIVLANKGFYSTSRIYKAEGYEKAREEFSSYKGNYGVKTGIIGAGKIGRLVIEMLEDYKLDVLVFDPFLPDKEAEALGVEKVSLERIFAECTVISNHLANNPETVGMLNGALFDTMLPYSTFINTGRGAQVVEGDLIALLKRRPDVTALLDVTFPEPVEAGSELYTLDNCILTPHIAGSSGNEVSRMAEFIIDEFDRYINGEPCHYEVSPEMLKTMA